MVVGILLYGGFLPGLHPHYAPPAFMTIGGRSYYYTAIVVPVPLFGLNYTFPEWVLFHNVTFWYWVTNWSLLRTTLLDGNATLANGTTYAFTVGNGPPLGPHTTQYVSPGGEVAVLWTGGIQADLLVLA